MTTGEGGMVVTDNEEIADAAARFVNHGRDGTYSHVDVGHNFRLTSIGAAIGRAQLEKLPEYIEARRKNARRLTEHLSGTDLTVPHEPDGYEHVYHQYTVRVDDRERLQRHLDDHDIGYGVYYPTAIHEQPAYEEVDVSAPVAERATEEVLSLPIHPSVSDRDIDRMSEVLTTYE